MNGLLCRRLYLFVVCSTIIYTFLPTALSHVRTIVASYPRSTMVAASRRLMTPQPFLSSVEVVHQGLLFKYVNTTKLRLTSSETVCLYTGFLRDFLRMVETCPAQKSKCDDSEVVRLYGSHRKNLWEGTGCDIVMTTWDVEGAGS